MSKLKQKSPPNNPVLIEQPVEDTLAQILLELKWLHRVMCSGCLHCCPIADPELDKKLTAVLGVGPDDVGNR